MSTPDNTFSEPYPVCLTIAGSDSGGGAGLQADLRAFRHFRVHGCTAITAVTAQNPLRVAAVQPVAADILRAQLDCVADAFALAAIKTGMLADAERVRVVADFLPRLAGVPLVVDPVMVATSGARLLAPDAIGLLRECLLPAATLVTPNLPEAELLLGRSLAPGDYPAAARALHERFGAAILLKGGHNPEHPADDFLCEADGTLWRLSAPAVLHPLTTHGTGCTLSAAIAANLARRRPLLKAVRRAKGWLLALLSAGVPAGRAAVYGDAPEDGEPDAVAVQHLD